MDVQERRSGKIYSLASTNNVPEWLSERSRRNLAKRDSQFRRRITLLQDLEMPVASTKVRQSPDGRFLIVGGTYSPRIRCYELSEMSMKFERYLDSEVVDLLILGSDYGKLAILGSDRTVMFHAPYGNHEKIRLPTFGRAMAYEKSTCDLLVVSSGKRVSPRNVAAGQQAMGEVYRFNLDEGRFSQPYSFPSALRTKRYQEQDLAMNAQVLQLGGACIAVSPTHSLAAIGAEDGTVRLWDNRAPTNSLSPFLNLDVASATSGYGYFDEMANSGFPGEVTSVCFDSSGLHMCAGTKGGNVALFDMRSSKPLFVKEHQYGLPIHTVQFHSGSGTVLSSDPKLVKIWNAKGSAKGSTEDGWDGALDTDVSESEGLGGATGSIVANVEGTADFSHFIACGDESDSSGGNNGLLLCAGEQSKVQSFYCPVLGSAPKWCSFLDNITEELEERDGALDKTADESAVDQTVYEDYKFLTRSEIDSLSISNLVGTPLLRGYMHGFFIHVGLYNRIRSVAKPFEYNEYRTQKIKERIDEKRASRIAPKAASQKVKAKVNLELADRLHTKAGNKTKSGKVAKSLVEDDRFGGLFSNPDFEIDEEAEDFKLRNPSGIAAKRVNNDRDMDSDQEDDEVGFDPLEREISSQDTIEDEYQQSDSDEDGFEGGRVRGEEYEMATSNSVTEKMDKKENSTKKKKKKKNVKLNMYVADDYIDGDKALDVGLGSALHTHNKRKNDLSLSMAERLESQSEPGSIETKRLKVKGQGSSKEVTFIPRSSKKKNGDPENVADGKRGNSGRSRRGVKELGFRKPFKHQ